MHLDAENIKKAMCAFKKLDYRPRPPVKATDFSVPEIRAQWREEKGLRVFSFWSPAMPATEIDVFIDEPFPFAEMYTRSIRIDLDSTEVVVACIEDLIKLKKRARRPKDIHDIEALETIVRLKKEAEDG